MNRYSRQAILPEVGVGGQEEIGSAHILIVGAGGLGAPAFQYLVGAGVGQITIVDPDIVAQHNLHRQPIYGADEGRLKVVAAAEFARTLNPQVTVTPVAEWLTPSNAAQYVSNADIVLDCADSFAVSYTLSDICMAAGKPLISASALGLSGYVGGFCGGAPSLRAVFPELPDNVANCDAAGVLGPVVGMLGLLQAQMALSHILKMKPSPLGQLVRYAMSGFRSSTFRFDGACEPMDEPHRYISIEDVVESDEVIDLRSTSEAPKPITPTARRISLDELNVTPIELSPNARVVLACRSGLRAWRAADHLRKTFDGEIKLLAVPLTLGTVQ